MLLEDTCCIGVKTSFEALHRWKDAPDVVAFLRNYHRHMFYVIVRLPVQHDDRALEFFIVKRRIDAFINDRYGRIVKQFDDSCEMIASAIAEYVVHSLKVAWCTVQVSEDKENFAEVKVTRQKHSAKGEGKE